MIRGLVQILLFQGLGEIISKLLGLPIPGPVIGLVLLLATLLIRRRMNADLMSMGIGLHGVIGAILIPLLP